MPETNRIEYKRELTKELNLRILLTIGTIVLSSHTTLFSSLY